MPANPADNCKIKVAVRVRPFNRRGKRYESLDYQQFCKKVLRHNSIFRTKIDNDEESSKISTQISRINSFLSMSNENEIT
jgi:hypothetical protein